MKYDYVNTADNPEDILTKALARDKHEKFGRSMGGCGGGFMFGWFLFSVMGWPTPTRLPVISLFHHFICSMHMWSAGRGGSVDYIRLLR